MALGFSPLGSHVIGRDTLTVAASFEIPTMALVRRDLRMHEGPREPRQLALGGCSHMGVHSDHQTNFVPLLGKGLLS